jgi:hypothetical protein
VAEEQVHGRGDKRKASIWMCAKIIQPPCDDEEVKNVNFEAMKEAKSSKNVQGPHREIPKRAFDVRTPHSYLFLVFLPR